MRSQQVCADQARTRHVSPEELALALAPFTAARSIAQPRAVRPRVLTRSREIDARLGARKPRRLLAWQRGWFVVVLGGFSFGVLVAVVIHHVQPSAPGPVSSTPPAALRPVPAPVQYEHPNADVEPEMPDAQRVFDTLAVPLAPAERRHAVDALLAGRTRVALEQYQRLLASERAGLSDADAIDRVVTLLARELRACEQEAETPCGL
ncbi:MAG TPA: hypothetical protein VI299_23325 [Polyangiales bacterium]